MLFAPELGHGIRHGSEVVVITVVIGRRRPTCRLHQLSRRPVVAVLEQQDVQRLLVDARLGELNLSENRTFRIKTASVVIILNIIITIYL